MKLPPLEALDVVGDVHHPAEGDNIVSRQVSPSTNPPTGSPRPPSCVRPGRSFPIPSAVRPANPSEANCCDPSLGAYPRITCVSLALRVCSSSSRLLPVHLFLSPASPHPLYSLESCCRSVPPALSLSYTSSLFPRSDDFAPDDHTGELEALVSGVSQVRQPATTRRRRGRGRGGVGEREEPRGARGRS